jgi:hypothetical protein
MHIHEIRKANREAGYHFFDPDTLRFFDSRIETVTNGRKFLTSEQFHGSTESGPRKWTIRELQDDGSIETVSEFQEFASKAEALEAMREENG